MNVLKSLRSVFSLSLGTLVVQSLSAGGQFVLAIWLTPDEFGYWAAAVSAMTLLTALTNFGEVNGYLSGLNNSLRVARRNALKLNSLLSLFGICIALLYQFADNTAVAVYCLVLSLTIPLNGEADLRIAAGVHYKKFPSIVSSQAIAALAKFLSSIAVAYTFRSAIALAVSITLYYLVVCLLLRKVHRHAEQKEQGLEHSVVPLKSRFEWAINSYFMTFPVQAIFLSAQFFVDPTQLGLLFIGFQITLALSGLLSVPLNRIVLSTLSTLESSQRGSFVSILSFAISIIVTLISAALALALLLGKELLPEQWKLAIPIAIAFLVAMPMRILTPIIEARQQVEKRWIQATTFNLIESLGSIILVAVISQRVSLVGLALAISAWKIIFGTARTIYVLRHETVWTILTSSFFSILGAILLTIGLMFEEWGNLLTIVVSMFFGVVAFILFRRNQRSIS